MTPVEVFYLYYSHAIANYMLRHSYAATSDKLVIYEIGGGAGTMRCVYLIISRYDPCPIEATLTARSY